MTNTGHYPPGFGPLRKNNKIPVSKCCSQIKDRMSEKAKPKNLDLKKVRNHKLERGTFKMENVTKATKIFHGQENGLLSYFVSVLSIYFFSKKKEVIGITVSLQCQKTAHSPSTKSIQLCSASSHFWGHLESIQIVSVQPFDLTD